MSSSFSSHSLFVFQPIETNKIPLERYYNGIYDDVFKSTKKTTD